MTEREFEARFGAALRDYADRAPLAVDPLEVAVTAATIAAAPRRTRLMTTFRQALAGAGSFAILLLLLLVLLIAAIAGSRLIHRQPLPPDELGFTATAPMTIPRPGVVAVLLTDGRVLLIGGHTPDLGNGFVVSYGTAEIHDPTTGTFTPTGPMHSPRLLFTASRLADGRVLVAGGDPTDGATSAAELFDPVTGTWRPTGSMAGPRRQHSASVLPDGTVLLVGGSDGPDELATAERYDPGTGRFEATGMLHAPRMLHGATVLRDGRVLIAGGVGADGSPLASAELYDPATGTFADTGPMTLARVAPSLVPLPDGRVLVTDAGSTEAELYDPATGTFSGTGPMSAPHTAAVPLADGRVLAVGGAGRLAELYDEDPGTFSPTLPMAASDPIESAIALEDGRVLLLRGGAGESEVFDPQRPGTSGTLAVATPAPGSSTGPPSAPPAVDPCALVTPEDIRSILGVPSDRGSLSPDDPDVPTCAWTTPAGEQVLAVAVVPYAPPVWSALEASPAFAPFGVPGHPALVQGGRDGELWVQAGSSIVHLWTPTFPAGASGTPAGVHVRLMEVAVARLP
jgi:hypothetical protein